jgi:hypothetical protein
VAVAYANGPYWPEPLPQVNPRYKADDDVDTLAARGEVHPDVARIFRFNDERKDGTTGAPLRLHRHQREALAFGTSRQSFVITTGTGSGKALCFFVPIINAIRKAKAVDPAPRTRAIFGDRTRRWEVGKPAVLTPNLLQLQNGPTKANAARAADITHIRTWQGWLYLAVVIDLFSRKVVGRAAGPTIHHHLVLNALASAVKQRRPHWTIIHAEQGVQFGCDAWRRYCPANYLEPSMGKKGNC